MTRHIHTYIQTACRKEAETGATELCLEDSVSHVPYRVATKEDTMQGEQIQRGTAGIRE